MRYGNVLTATYDFKINSCGKQIILENVLYINKTYHTWRLTNSPADYQSVWYYYCKKIGYYQITRVYN